MSAPSSVARWWNGQTGRGAFVLSGLGLMLAKYNLDRFVAYQFGRTNWDWTSYWRPSDAPLNQIDSYDARVFYVLLALALPFVAIGIGFTVRRLRDCGWPLWLAALFFVPVANLVFFAALSVAPSREEKTDIPPRLTSSWLPTSSLGSALLAIAVTSTLGVGCIGIATKIFQTYGWGVFVALPFTLGLSVSLLHCASEPRTLGQCIGITTLAVAICAAVIVGIALEGVMCIAMAAPLALVVALLGAVVGHSMTRVRFRRVQCAPWAAVLCIVAVDAQDLREPPLISATTKVLINAEPTAVWPHVVQFSELPPPSEWVFRTGIAYPVRAHIDGSGVGAIRRCEFSTGPFIEPITTWNEPHHLAFGVTQQPHPMRELSPYRSLEPAHLEGFFRSRRGEFVLTRLPDGRTELAGTTWYDQRIWPNRYWQVWSDYLVHRIHTRVLNHIKTEVEASAKS